MARITHRRDKGAEASRAACRAVGRCGLARFPVVAAIALGLTGCIAPRAGPALSVPAASDGLGYCLVEVNADTLPRLARATPEPPGGLAGSGRPPGLRLGKGDVVSLTVFEAAAGGLFIPLQAGARPGNFVELPRQAIEADGQLSVPYAGTVKAAGLTVAELQDAIVEKLRPRSIEPQVIVTVLERQAAEVSVLGQVNAPTRFALSNAPTRLLDAIARAGGAKAEGFETYVTLLRHGRSTTTSFHELMAKPSVNVALEPGDSVYVHRRQRSYNVIGASGQAGRFVFDTPTVSVADALARAGGLGEGRGGPTAVYLYRFEVDAPSSAMVYRFDMRSALGFFYAGKALVRDRDLIYVAAAPQASAMRIADIWQVVAAGGASPAPGQAAPPLAPVSCSHR
ncbi:polysaccharide biosynthesis/export family protein [Chelatococcus reniformis]|uniref:Sugar ABC transporter substrate-binding protein n=1 Tax=Chelatococcus reniformis TaxID=1494448 RepID=A0A916UM99_9HYPH|nr:polysaccharide biosynthesis/export family protein [Chelatococcus reniformis]GGC78911.1 sugar ABC transporter substrate-binding protein [Chelatococcus reniformis]